MKKSLSVIIPAHNEEKTISRVINELENELSKLDLDYEIIIVDDTSTDKTKEIIEKIPGIKILNHHINQGYGASLKTGIREAQFNNLLFFDADDQHKPEYISEMIKYIDDFDLVVGARTGYKGPIIRQPGKKLLHWLANYLTKQKIPDLNSGLRMVKKDQISKFLHLLCDGFSFSTTTTILFIGEGLRIKYVPITINKRLSESKSKIRPKHAIDTFILILRTILLSSPLKVFLPMSSLFFIGALATLVYDALHPPFNITDITILLLLSSILIFFFGLLADQITAIRRELRK
jgi:glycosyltransferase involved in cell wall biosynthesis